MSISMFILVICTSWIIFICMLNAQIRKLVLCQLLPCIAVTAGLFFILPPVFKALMDFLTRNIRS
ncbi:hypothetical protein AIDNDMCJ_19167 (plasmid) [Bacillus safensis]|uniref:Uncharacterized protein n=1 Tax=Bacillus pumilus TaxID=1408 RepID=A0A9Q9T516_BACPU|nr:hypothetical protein SBRMV_042 [Bacillus pumilus]VCT99234.1 hypothetical protein AIDNDMCJ_19167 [Bacillus safensis]